MKKYAFIVFAFAFQLCFSQTKNAVPEKDPNAEPFMQHKSIHQEQAEKYANYNLRTEAQWDSLRAVESGAANRSVIRSTQSCNLTKRVYGWQPYWDATSATYNNYDWNGLTDLCYFSYDVNSADGTASSTHGWSSATVVTAAQANGVNVTLCATLFSGHTAFFGNATAQQTLISNLISAVQSRNAHGVNIDFEGMGASHKTAFTNFMINLCNQMHAAIPGSEVSIALYSVDWSGVFDMQAMDPYVDLFIIMGYDYYYSGSTTAGPEDPLYNFQTSYNYTLSKSISYYLNKGASKSKLLLGLPYYGREWATNSLTAPSATSGGGTNTVLFNTMRNNASGNYSSRQWDVNSFSSWFPSTRAGASWQAFVDDAASMSKRFDIVNQFGIGGIGIWALGYDDGYNDFWDLIQNKFTD
jgi:spore germination protein YaaH